MKFIKHENYSYHRGAEVYNKKQVIDFIKQGREVTIVDSNGIEITKEFKYQEAFGGHLVKPKNKDDFLILDFMIQNVDEDLIEDIIQAGGIENWLIRSRN